MRNAFDREIPEIRDIVKDGVARDYIDKYLTQLLQSLDIDDAEQAIDDVLRIAAEHGEFSKLDEYEQRAHEVIEKTGACEIISERLSNRAELIYSQIKDHIEGQKVLDYGCGDGKVGELISRSGLEVTLSDIYKHGHIDETGLKFEPLVEGDPAPIEGGYDTTLLLTVKHHAEDPMQVLRDAKRLTKKGGRMIVIESVIGIDDKTEFGQLSHEDQWKVNVFFDHFYNRVIHYNADPSMKVKVPWNLNTQDGWRARYEAEGLKLEKVIRLGIDQALVPEYHDCYVLRVA
ncbi:MAG: methyltransferase domain-containing protein [Nanoarchaeota archaeon]|nr:methyltransferase domain-containing protein [Nanoarchaeota archaeon]